ncbi:MAG: MarP family serine protease [Rhodoglobus sp.]
MPESIVLDVVLVVVLIGYIGYGVKYGLSRSVFVIIGTIAGIIAALLFTPIVTEWVSFPIARPFVTVIVALGLVVIGHAIGSAIGRGIRGGVAKSALSGFDRLLGGIVTGIVAALVTSMIAFSVGQLGVPMLSQAIAGSTVLRTIHAITPAPVDAFIAQVRGAFVEGSQPIISDAFGGNPPVIPQIDTGSPALNAAAESVVRITGNAYECGQSQSGSGFVVSDDRVITNAHVVAGVTEPVIEAPNGEALVGTVVYFDPIDDLAVIAVPELSAPPLPRSTTIAAGTDAAVQGYPLGGPFVSGGAHVETVSSTMIDNVYGEGSTLREVYRLAADVRQGNSGGPLLTLDGELAGVVFARSADTPTIGYAMTMAEVEPVAVAAPSLRNAVASGVCIKG